MVRETGIGRCAGNYDCFDSVLLFFYSTSFVSLLLFLGFRVADNGGAEGTGFDCGET